MLYVLLQPCCNPRKGYNIVFWDNITLEMKRVQEIVSYHYLVSLKIIRGVSVKDSSFLHLFVFLSFYSLSEKSEPSEVNRM
jgi:hypothetical protein